MKAEACRRCVSRDVDCLPTNVCSFQEHLVKDKDVLQWGRLHQQPCTTVKQSKGLFLCRCFLLKTTSLLYEMDGWFKSSITYEGSSTSISCSKIRRN